MVFGKGVGDLTALLEWQGTTCGHRWCNCGDKVTTGYSDPLPKEELEAPLHPFKIYGMIRHLRRVQIRDVRAYVRRYAPRRLQRFS